MVSIDVFKNEVVHTVVCSTNKIKPYYLESEINTFCKVSSGYNIDNIIVLSIKNIEYGDSVLGLKSMTYNDVGRILDAPRQNRIEKLKKELLDHNNINHGVQKNEPEGSKKDEIGDPLARWRRLQEIRDKQSLGERLSRALDEELKSSRTESALDAGIFFASTDHYENLFMRFNFWDDTSTEIMKLSVKN